MITAAFIALSGTCVGLGVLAERRQHKRAMRNAAIRQIWAGTAARADYEHHMTLTDQPTGTYGQYQPARLPGQLAQGI